jgi:hypothetical protein
MRYYIGVTMALLGIILVGSAQFIGIGTVLYDWSHNLAFSMAAWNGFVRWIVLSLIGIILTVAGLIIKE